MMAIGLLSLLVTTVLPIVLVVLLVRHLAARSGGTGGDGRAVRRFFQYTLLFGLMVVAATGVTDLCGQLVDAQSVRGGGGADLARALTFTVFGIPMVAVVAAWVRRDLRRDADEKRSWGWGIYVTLASLTALVVAMGAAGEVISAALDGRVAQPASFVRLVVWALVWWVHWLLGERLLAVSARQPHLALGSLIGLGTSITGLVWLLGAAITTMMGDVEGAVVVGARNELAAAGACLAVGVPVWWLYWLRRFSAAPRRGLWLGYVLLVGVGGSLVMTVVGATTSLYSVLVWFVGDPSAALPGEHFAGTPLAAASVLVGGVSWWYHRDVFARGAPAGRSEVMRIYEYLLSGIALVAGASGITLALVALIEAVTPVGDVEVGTSPANSLLAAMTVLVVAGPLWWLFWRRIERIARAAPTEELASPARRIYLFVLFGVGGVIAVVVVLVAAFIGIQDALEGRLSGETLRTMRVPLALLVTTGAVSGCHWLVFRHDRTVAPHEAARGPREVLLVGPADDDLAEAVHRATGARVELWIRSGDPWAVEEVLEAVAGVPGAVVAVIAGSDGVQAFTVEGRRRI